ncbi:MAG: ATP-binding protein [Deltaproteobacteria bacterium]|nr:ATP-binding protein [Deltaproteobacteria bacterium]
MPPSRSLQRTYALWVTVLILAPLLAWFAVEIRAQQASILESRVEVLQAFGDLLVARVEEGCDGVALQGLLERFEGEHPELDILLLDDQLTVLAATEADWLGRPWDEAGDEEEIWRVVRGEEDRPWALDSHDGVPVLELTLAVHDARGAVAAVHVAESQDTLLREVRAAWMRQGFFAAGLLVALAALVMGLTHRLILRRVVRLELRMRQTGWLPEAVRIGGGNELDALGVALEALLVAIADRTRELEGALAERGRLLVQVEGFNAQLTAEVEAARAEIVAMQAELVKRERLAAMGELSGALAHEIRNPLQIIRGTAELVRRRHPEAAEGLSDVIGEVLRLNDMVTRLLQFTRPLDLRAAPFSAHRMVTRAVQELPALPLLEQRCPPELEGYGDELLLGRVLVNLLQNAAEAGAEHLILRVERGHDRWSIAVTDDGEGIDEEDVTRLFTPFFTRKPAGTGLGLAFSRKVVEEHRGRIEVSSQRGKGTTMTVVLPVG